MIKLAKHLRRYYRSYHQRTANVLFIHFGRVGSTVVADLLSQHPRVHMAGEVYESYRVGSVKAPLLLNNPRKLMWYYLCQTAQPVFGAEVKLFPEEHMRESLLNMDFESAFAYFDRLGFNKFVYINRRNLLRRAISDSIGVKTAVWHRRDTGTPHETKITLDLSKIHFGDSELPLLETFDRLSSYHEIIFSNLSKRPSLTLNYENDIQPSPEIAYGKLLEFLDLDHFDPQVRFAKTNSGDWREKLSNWKEVESLLLGTSYAWMLDN